MTRKSQVWWSQVAVLFKLLMSEQYNKILITAGVLYRFGKMITRKVKVVSFVDLYSPSFDRLL
jgi:hypothetical protein